MMEEGKSMIELEQILGIGPTRDSLEEWLGSSSLM